MAGKENNLKRQKTEPDSGQSEAIGSPNAEGWATSSEIFETKDENKDYLNREINALVKDLQQLIEASPEGIVVGHDLSDISKRLNNLQKFSKFAFVSRRLGSKFYKTTQDRLKALHEIVSEMEEKLGLGEDATDSSHGQNLVPKKQPSHERPTTPDESQIILNRFEDFRNRLLGEIEVLSKSPPEVTADSDSVEIAYQDYYEALESYEEQFANNNLDQGPIRELEIRVLESEFFCRGAATLIGQGKEELKERSASSQADWDAHVVEPKLLKRMEQIVGIIAQRGDVNLSNKLLRDLQSIGRNYSNRKLLQYSWCQVMSSLEGDGETVSPPSGLVDSNFPFSGKTMDYFVNSSEGVPELLGGWLFNPTVGRLNYQLPNFFDISGETRINGSYDQTLFDYLMQVMDEIYAGKRKDARNNRGQQINSRNLDVSKSEIYEYLAREARKKIEQELRLGNQSSIDEEAVLFLDDQNKLAQDQLEVMVVLAYRVSMLGTGHRVWLSPGTVYGQSAKAIYDTDPNYWWNYRLTNEGGWHVLQFLNLWGIPGVNHYDLLYGKEGLKYQSKRDVVRIKMRDSKKKLLNPNSPMAQERFQYFGTTTYDFLFDPIINLINECRQADPDTGLPVESKLRLNPSLFRQQALKVDSDELNNRVISFDFGGVPLRFGINPDNAGKPVGEGNEGMLVTFDHLVDPNTGRYLYSLMPLEQLGTEWIQYYRGWANNVRSFMDKFLLCDAQTFSANLEDPKVLAGIKKTNKYVAPYQPKVGAEAAAQSKMRLPNGWEAKYAEILENTIIVKLVLTKLQLDFSIYHTKSASQISQYLEKAYEAGILGPGEIGKETREALYIMVTKGGEVTEFAHRTLATLVEEIRQLNIYGR